jgi:hypothetical protein
MKRFFYTTLGLFGMMSFYAHANAGEDALIQHSTVTIEEKVFTSKPITVSDLNMPVKVKIQGHGSYEVNGKDMGKRPTVVRNGDVIVLKQKAPERDEGKVSTTLIIGNKYDRFTIVTRKTENLYHVCSTYAKVGELPSNNCR